MSTGFLAAESTAGKTFIALYLAFAIALELPFFGKKTKKGGVMYVAAEAPGTIPIRMEAARSNLAMPLVAILREKQEGDIDLDTAKHLPIAVINDVPDLTTYLGMKKLIDTAKAVHDDMLNRYGVPLRLIVIDTVIMAFPIKSWNDPAETSKVTRAMSALCKGTGAAMLGVAHHGKDIGKGIAGSFALKANVDTVLSILMDTGEDALSGQVLSRHIALTKWRDGPTGWQHEFKLQSVHMGTNADNREVHSAYVVPVENGTRIAAVKKDKVGRGDGRAFKAFKDAFNEASIARGELVTVRGDGPQVRAVRRELVRTEFDVRYGADVEDNKKAAEARRKAFGRGLDEASKKWGILEGTWAGADWLWRAA
jgi:hypothetical protein